MAVLDIVRTHGVSDQPQHRLSDPPTAARMEGALRRGLRAADEVLAAAA